MRKKLLLVKGLIAFRLWGQIRRIVKHCRGGGSFRPTLPFSNERSGVFNTSADQSTTNGFHKEVEFRGGESGEFEAGKVIYLAEP